jgi:hypothetical protein
MMLVSSPVVTEPPWLPPESVEALVLECIEPWLPVCGTCGEPPGKPGSVITGTFGKGASSPRPRSSRAANAGVVTSKSPATATTSDVRIQK